MRKTNGLILSILIVIFAVNLSAQDIAGEYKLSGLNVYYYNICRVTTPLMVSDIYGIGVTTPIKVINEGDVFYATFNGPHSEEALTQSGVNLNVNLYADGTGEVVEGSFYPDVNVDPEVCISSVQVLPILDYLVYTSNLDAGLIAQPTNIIGLPDGSTYVGQTVGGFSLSQSVIFDYFPESPAAVSIPSDVNIDTDGDGVPDLTLPANQDLPGDAVGYCAKGDLTSLSPDNVAIGNNPDLYIEWHAIDGELAQGGLGEIIGVDEDGDGTDFDRIFGLPYVTVTNMNTACGYNYPIVGDVSAIFEGLGLGFCVESVSVGNDFYLMDAQFATWGNFLTYNAVVFSATLEGLMAQGMTYEDALNYIMTNQPEILADDSDHDFDGASGRLVMHFVPTCIPQYEEQTVCAEFRQLDVCDPDGDINVDGNLDVLDIVALVAHILNTNPLPGYQACHADINDSGTIDILDVVIIVDMIINQRSGRERDANSAVLLKHDNQLDISADGFVGGIQMTLKHGPDFSIELNDDNYMAQYNTQDNETSIVIVHPGTTLFTAKGEYQIENVVVANSSDYVAINIADSFGLLSNYPNPFNPETRIDYSLLTEGNVSINVYDMQGRMVTTLVNDFRASGNYSVVWNGTNQNSEALPSGIYLVKMVSAGQVVTQKVTLLK